MRERCNVYMRRTRPFFYDIWMFANEVYVHFGGVVFSLLFLEVPQ